MRKAELEDYSDKEIKRLLTIFNKQLKPKFRVNETRFRQKLSEIDCNVDPDYHRPSLSMKAHERIDGIPTSFTNIHFKSDYTTGILYPKF